MKLTSKILILLGSTAAMLHGQSQFFETGPYDVGRTQTNPTVTNNRPDIASWWNGTGDTPANVGWNSNGIWWSFALFGSTERTNENPDLFNAINAADEIYFHVGIAWLELAPSLEGVLDPGAMVDIYLVPGMDVPANELGGWDYTWPFLSQFDSTRIKVATIDPQVAPVLRGSGPEFREGSPFATPPVSAPTEQERRDNLVAYDITAGIKAAITSGDLTASTSWGLALFPSQYSEASARIANDPAWASLQQTVFDGTYMILETVVLETETWAGYDIDVNGNVDTGAFMGILNVDNADWVYSFDLSSWVYLPESNVGSAGAWGYVPQ